MALSSWFDFSAGTWRIYGGGRSSSIQSNVPFPFAGRSAGIRIGFVPHVHANAGSTQSMFVSIKQNSQLTLSFCSLFKYVNIFKFKRYQIIIKYSKILCKSPRWDLCWHFLITKSRDKWTTNFVRTHGSKRLGHAPASSIISWRHSFLIFLNISQKFRPAT